ncbi:hypothetical protein KY285_003519 [Solanum tuberosum]|nr:hypothetical protein KY289_003865 [Solanum tuberosum]KAH0767648.1 hypothetical protein KY285_003519 [Solanum tuberosum]
MCDSLVAIHKHVDKDSKVINFARGLGLKYKTFRTVMLDEEEASQQNHNMAFSAQRGMGRENNNFNSRERDFKPAGQGVGSQNSQYRQGSPSNQSFLSENKERSIIESCQICGRNNHTALKCFYRWDYSYQSTDELPQEPT